MGDGESLDICPKCIFEGIRSKLSKPKKTEKGWVSTCEKGHKIYPLMHCIIVDGLVVDQLEQKAYSLSIPGKN